MSLENLLQNQNFFRKYFASFETNYGRCDVIEQSKFVMRAHIFAINNFVTEKDLKNIIVKYENKL